MVVPRGGGGGVGATGGADGGRLVESWMAISSSPSARSCCRRARLGGIGGCVVRGPVPHRLRKDGETARGWGERSIHRRRGIRADRVRWASSARRPLVERAE